LAQYLAAEDELGTDIPALTAKQVVLKPLELEQVD
jgi:hypothetical protein